MRADDLLFALLAVIAFVAVVPSWLHYMGRFEAQTGSGAFLASLVLPATLLLLVTSWINPELSTLIVGASVLLFTVVTLPWWWQFIDMVSAELVDEPLARWIIQVSIPLLVIWFIVSLARRKLAGGRPT